MYLDVNSLLNRPLELLLLEALQDTPAVLIHGPRQCGKTTLAQSAEPSYNYITFDDPTTLLAAQEDPVGFLDRLPQRVILDEIQRIPELFVALKHNIDKDRKPGRFILTGSANVLLLPKMSDSLAGRMEVLRLHPLSQLEIEQQSLTFVERLFQLDFSEKKVSRLGTELIERAERGGFPAAIYREGNRRKRWYNNYLNALIQRDINDISRISGLDQIPKLFRLMATQTAQLTNVSELARAFQFTRPTIDHYMTLMHRLFLVDFLEPWFMNNQKRLVKTPKLHISDAGLLMAILGYTTDYLQKNYHKFGPVLESFVVSEIRRQLSWFDDNTKLFHYRDRDDYEIDLIVEQSNGQIFCIEVKSAASIHQSDLRSIRRFKEHHPDSFAGGIILFDGEYVQSFGDDIYGIPISHLWQTL